MPTSSERIARASAPLPELPADLEVEWRLAWRRDDPGLEADAMTFWAREGVLPAGVDPKDRAKELNLLAYVKGEVAAISTAVLRDAPMLRTRLAMHRCVVGRGFRRGNLARAINVQSIEAMAAWSQANPREKITGMGTIVQADVDSRFAPVWRTGFMLVGYNEQDEQVRVAWFKHARLD